MFGNRNGWILSLVILLCTAGLLWALYRRGTEPVAIGPIGRMAPTLTLTPPIPPRSVAVWMTDDADATELYRELLADVKANEIAYLDFKGLVNSADYARIRNGLDLLIQARTHRKASIFAATPETLVTNDLTLRPLRDHVKALRTASLKYATGLLAQQKPDEARQVLQAMFTLGVHLTEEKIIYEEWREGNELLAVSHYLKTAALSESEEQRMQMEEFDQKFKTFRIDRVAPLHLFVLKYDPDPARNDPVRLPGGQVAGFETWTADMIELARRSAEPTWRVEATMACGRARFTGLTNVDQRAAAATLRDLSSDANPHVRRAAQLGLALTRTELERMHPHLVP